MSHRTSQRASISFHQNASPLEIKTNNQQDEQRSRHTCRGLMLFADICAQRHADLQQYGPEKNIPSNSENDSATPHFDRFHEEGVSRAIMNLASFEHT